MFKRFISLLLTATMLLTTWGVGFSVNAEEENQSEQLTPQYFYDDVDSDDLENIPNQYFSGITLAHYFDIMGAKDVENNLFKPNDIMTSTEIEAALKAIDVNQKTHINFEGEKMDLGALVLRLWLAEGENEHTYTGAFIKSTLSKYTIDNVIYDENQDLANDLANAWTFCIKEGIISDILDVEIGINEYDDTLNSIEITRAMAANALTKYYLFYNYIDTSRLELDSSILRYIDLEKMNEYDEYCDDSGEVFIEKQVYAIGKYMENIDTDNSENTISHHLLLTCNENKIYMFLATVEDNKLDNYIAGYRNQINISPTIILPDFERILQNRGAHSSKKIAINTSIKLADWGRILHGIIVDKASRSHMAKKNEISKGIDIDFDLDDNHDDYESNGKAIVKELRIPDMSFDDLKNYLFGLAEGNEEYKDILDVNEDGVFDLLDIYLIYEKRNKTSNTRSSKFVRRSKRSQSQNSISVYYYDDFETYDKLKYIVNTYTAHYLKILPENRYLSMNQNHVGYLGWELIRVVDEKEQYYYRSDYGHEWLDSSQNSSATYKFDDESRIYNIPHGFSDELVFVSEWRESSIMTLDNNSTLQYIILDNGEAQITGLNTSDSSDSIKIPEKTNDNHKITSIAPYAFKNSLISNIELNDNITMIGKGAFDSCINLTEITIPQYVKTIKVNTFFCCENLSTVNLPQNLISIENEAFAFCTNLKTINLQNTKKIGSFAFAASGLEKIEIPDSVVDFGGYTFWGCDKLEEAKIPNTAAQITNGLFEGCISLTSVTIPDSVSEIGYYAFQECESLSSVTIPSGVTSLPLLCFADCKNLNITIPRSVTRIWDNAFNNCENLTIYCYKDSFAHNYAVQNGINYHLIDPKLIYYCNTKGFKEPAVYSWNSSDTIPPMEWDYIVKNKSVNMIKVKSDYPFDVYCVYVPNENDNVIFLDKTTGEQSADFKIFDGDETGKNNMYVPSKFSWIPFGENQEIKAGDQKICCTIIFSKNDQLTNSKMRLYAYNKSTNSCNAKFDEAPYMDKINCIKDENRKQYQYTYSCSVSDEFDTFIFYNGSYKSTPISRTAGGTYYLDYIASDYTDNTVYFSAPKDSKNVRIYAWNDVSNKELSSWEDAKAMESTHITNSAKEVIYKYDLDIYYTRIIFRFVDENNVDWQTVDIIRTLRYDHYYSSVDGTNKPIYIDGKLVCGCRLYNS